MSTLQKFNNTIEGLDKELIKLKDTSEAYQKLQGLVTSYAKTNELFIKNSTSLEEFAIQQQQKQGELAKSLTALQEANRAGKDEIKKQNEVFEKNISVLVETLRKENKDFYLDFEKTVKIKLDENKSEIKQLIENERYRIKEIFELELSKKTNDMLSKQKELQANLWIVGGLLIILNMVIVMKLLQ